MKKKIFFERLTQYVNSDSVSERKSMKESIIRELHEYAERYLNLHKKYNYINIKILLIFSIFCAKIMVSKYF